MAEMKAQQYLQTCYAQCRLPDHARRPSGDKSVEYAEAFQRDSR